MEEVKDDLTPLLLQLKKIRNRKSDSCSYIQKSKVKKILKFDQKAEWILRSEQILGRPT